MDEARLTCERILVLFTARWGVTPLSYSAITAGIAARWNMTGPEADY